MGNRYHLTASEGVGLVSEKRREAGGVLIPVSYTHLTLPTTPYV